MVQRLGSLATARSLRRLPRALLEGLQHLYAGPVKCGAMSSRDTVYGTRVHAGVELELFCGLQEFESSRFQNYRHSLVQGVSCGTVNLSFPFDSKF